MSEIIELDQVDPQPVTVKLGGQEIVIHPPTTLTVLRLGVMGRMMQNLDTLNDELLVNIQAELVKCAPELAGKTLTTDQLSTLVGLVIGMGMPGENKELEERGITVDTEKKTQ